MNLIEACKEMVEKGGEYVYREGDGEWLHRFYDNECSRTFLEQTCKGSPWTEKDAQLTKEDIFATDWQVHYAEPKLKPCAHCKNEGPEIRMLTYEFDILCRICQKRTYAYKTKAEAITAWNRRDGEEK